MTETRERTLPTPGEVKPTQPTRRPARRRVTRGSSIGSQVGTISALFIATLYFVTPIYWLLVSATKGTGTLFNSFGLWFKDPQLGQNLRDTFNYSGHIFLRWLANSLIYAVGGAIGATLIAAAAGYALAKYTFRGREALFSCVLAGVMLPSTALALPLYLMASKVGMLDTYWAVLLPNFVSPFGVYLMRVYAASAVPDEILAAARIDGAGEIRIFFSVALRLMTPAVVTVSLFQFVAIWNNYFLPLVMLTHESLFPSSLGLVLWDSQADRAPGLYVLTVTGTAVSVVILIAAILSLQRFWRSGLTLGALK